MNERSRTWMSLAGLLVAMTTTLACAADEATPGDEEPAAAEVPRVDDRAAEVLRAMTDIVSAAQQITIRATQTTDAALIDRLDRPESAQLTASLKRPDRFVASMTSDERERRMYFDGETFSLLNVGKSLYASTPMAGDFDQMARTLEERYGFSPPATELLLSDPYENLMGYIESVSYVGEEMVGETLSHHIFAVEEFITWNVWISVDGHLPVKIVATAAALEGAPQVELAGIEIDLQAQLDDGIFSFEPPPGAEEIRMATVDEIFEE